MSSSIGPAVGPTPTQELDRLLKQETRSNVAQLARLAQKANDVTRPILVNLLRNRGYPKLATEAGLELLARVA